MNRQFERECRDALDGLRFSEEAKERMMKNLIEEQEQKPARRRGMRPMRVALIAAALCLALAGTAAAAQYFGVQIVPGAGGDEDADIWMKGGITYYPMDSLSEEVAELEAPRGGHAAKAFDSWEEMEEFIGVDLMNNPVLDASRVKVKRFVFIWSGGRKRVEGRFVAIGSGGLTGLTSIQAAACYEIGGVSITVQGRLFTDRVAETGEDWDQCFLGYSFSDEAQVAIEDYTAPSGLEAQLMTVERDGSYPDKCLAVFSLNGIPFVLEVWVSDFGPDLAAAREAVLQVLDGFVV